VALLMGVLFAMIGAAAVRYQEPHRSYEETKQHCSMNRRILVLPSVPYRSQVTHQQFQPSRSRRACSSLTWVAPASSSKSFLGISPKRDR
jgi:hypothetical protein